MCTIFIQTQLLASDDFKKKLRQQQETAKTVEERYQKNQSRFNDVELNLTASKEPSLELVTDEEKK